MLPDYCMFCHCFNISDLQWLIVAGGADGSDSFMASTEILRLTNNENGNWIEKTSLPKVLGCLSGATLYGYFRVFGGWQADGKGSNDIFTWNHHSEEWMTENLSIDSTVYPGGVYHHAVTEASFTQLEDFCD